MMMNLHTNNRDKNLYSAALFYSIFDMDMPLKIQENLNRAALEKKFKLELNLNKSEIHFMMG